MDTDVNTQFFSDAISPSLYAMPLPFKLLDKSRPYTIIDQKSTNGIMTFWTSEKKCFYGNNVEQKQVLEVFSVGRSFMKIDINALSEDDLIDLHRRITERLRFLSQTRAHHKMLQFKVGDRVSFKNRTIDPRSAAC